MRVQRRIAITGGIGSGKSIVGKVFQSTGFPLYVADVEAKKLMCENSELKQKITDLLGEDAYSKNDLNKNYISKQIFENNDLRKRMNSIVHPAVHVHFENWCNNQESSIIFYESALIYETQSESRFNYTILVSANKEIKIKRIAKRDMLNRELIEKKISSQISDDKKKELADFHIRNNEDELILPQIFKILKSIKQNG